MGSLDERKLWKHWAFLKNELYIDEILESMQEHGVFSSNQVKDITNVYPSTRQMKAEKFLNSLINSGDKGFETFCNILRSENGNRHRSVLEKLGLVEDNIQISASAPVVNEGANNTKQPARPASGTSLSASDLSGKSSLLSCDGETGEKKRKQTVLAPKTGIKAWLTDSDCVKIENNEKIKNENVEQASDANHEFLSELEIASQMETERQEKEDDNVSMATGAIIEEEEEENKGAGEEGRDDRSAVDMKTLEEELIRIAPTIADLFQKFAKSTSKEPISEEEIRNVKQENARLRKTNRALIDKLNTFQHRIIRLQSENKKLREEGDGIVETKEELDRKENELKELEQRLEEQKAALEAKELELDNQLMKIAAIEENISQQRQQIEQLQIMHHEDKIENERQQEEIFLLREEKKKQQQQILKLEFKQRIGEERLQSLDARLKQLENPKRTASVRKSDPKYKQRRPLGMFY